VAWCKWIVESMRPVRIVKDQGLHEIIKTGRPGYEIPSESTVRRDLDVIFDVVEDRVGNLLRVSDVYLFSIPLATHHSSPGI
jgi:hypothetical protein